MGIRRFVASLRGSMYDGIDPTVLRLGDASPVMPYTYQHLPRVDTSAQLVEIREIINSPEGHQALLELADSALANVEASQNTDTQQ